MERFYGYGFLKKTGEATILAESTKEDALALKDRLDFNRSLDGPYTLVELFYKDEQP